MTKPPKKPKPPTQPQGPPIAIPADAQARWQQEEALRSVEVAFVTDRLRSPLDYWWEQICSRVGVSYELVRERAERGGWHTRREEYWQAVSNEVLTRSKNRAVRDRLAELEQISTLREELVYLLTPKVVGGRKTFLVPPRSYEGVANAFIRFDQLADHKRQNILAAIDPQLVQVQQADSKAPQGAGSSLTTSELEKVARLLLQERLSQQQLREVSPASPPPPDEDDDEYDDDE